jgi:acetylornithine/N-succinyldiaminopimelate aminotransferase
MLEPIQGEGGVMPAKPGFMQRIRELCDQHDALMVLDEIQVGMGRTGTLFAHWQEGVKPDIVTLAKALGGGFPIGAMLAGPKVAETMQFGAHGTTFGGNPLAAAVARVALRKLSSPEIAHNVGRQSQALREGLGRINDEFKVFSQVRGRGLMLGAVLDRDFAGQAGTILDRAAEQGLLTLQAGPDVLRFVPSLNITDEEIAEGLKRLRAAVQSFIASR